MVRVIEHRRDAEHERLVELHVHPKPDDRSVAVAYVRSPVPHRLGYRWQTSNMDLPVDQALRAAVQYASDHAISFVWVNDPFGLFPPEARRSLP